MSGTEIEINRLFPVKARSSEDDDIIDADTNFREMRKLLADPDTVEKWVAYINSLKLVDEANASPKDLSGKLFELQFFVGILSDFASVMQANIAKASTKELKEEYYGVIKPLKSLFDAAQDVVTPLTHSKLSKPLDDQYLSNVMRCLENGSRIIATLETEAIRKLRF